MKKKNIVISGIVASIIFTIFIAVKTLLSFYAPYQGKNTGFTIRSGEGFSSINYRLSNKKFIDSARIFHYFAKYTNSLNRFKAGTYEIKPGMHMGNILEVLTEGVPILTSVTIPEGKNMFEIGQILEKNKITSSKDFISECRNQENIKKLGIKAPSIEGYLFPDTYKFAPNTPVKLIIKTMTNLFNKKTDHLNFDKTFLSKHQAIILASIVEKETGAKAERPTIAGVYLNRLKKKMRLQADPTTIYGIWEGFDGNLRRKHLLQKTSYNTYKMSGLPLGPIASPSLAAIKAVLQPKKHKYIYFVSKNDGTHIFTSTYKEHLKAVDYWQKTRHRRKGKSWRDLKQ